MGKFGKILSLCLLSFVVANGSQVETQPGDVNGKAEEKLTKVRYDGDQLWLFEYLEPGNEDIPMTLVKKFGSNLWRGDGTSHDVYVPYAQRVEAENYLKSKNQTHIVIIEDVQQLIDAEKDKYQEVDRLNWDDYHNFTLMEKFLKSIEAEFPNLTRLFVAGHTYENRPLYILSIGDNHPDNKVIFIEGGTHAREWIGPATATFLVNELVRKWDLLPEHMRRRQWYIMPVVNPDGYEYSRQYERLWGKNRQVYGENQCIGADVGTNYDYKWNDYDMVLEQCHNLYRGPSPLSERENQAITNFTKALDTKPSVYLTLHCYGQVLLYPWGYTLEPLPDRDDLHFAAQKAIDEIKKTTGSSFKTMSSSDVFGPGAGGIDDWARANLNTKYAYYVELVDTYRFGFLLSSKHIKSIGSEVVIIARVMSEVLD